MCGIAGIIYRDGTHEIGRDMTRMLQSMKHRGPDSTGYALYGPPNDGLAVMRYTLADSNTPLDRLKYHLAHDAYHLGQIMQLRGLQGLQAIV